jgi:hypothetical protein
MWPMLSFKINTNDHLCALIYLSMALQSSCWTLVAFSVSWSYTQSVGPLGRGISQSQGRYLYPEQRKHRIKGTQTSKPWVGFEPTIPVSERAKTVHVFDGSATVTDLTGLCMPSRYAGQLFVSDLCALVNVQVYSSKDFWFSSNRWQEKKKCVIVMVIVIQQRYTCRSNDQKSNI